MGMDTKIAGKARQILASAEAEVRGLITNAAEAQDYQAVSDLAELAQTLSSLTETSRFLRSESVAEGSSVAYGASLSQARKPKLTKRSNSPQQKPNKARGAAKDYPKYHTDRDRLIKIGWSKKHRDTYEHKAPREAVEAVAHALNEKASGRVVTVDELGTIETLNGNEVPVYQVYMTIAWLIVINQLSKEGRDGYRVDDNVGSIDLNKVWGSTLKGEA